MGEQVFKQMAQELAQQPAQYGGVSLEQYLQWKREYTFNTLKHTQRYGENFCNVFDITDNILLYESDYERADDRIRRCYVV